MYFSFRSAHPELLSYSCGWFACKIYIYIFLFLLVVSAKNNSSIVLLIYANFFIVLLLYNMVLV